MLTKHPCSWMQRNDVNERIASQVQIEPSYQNHAETAFLFFQKINVSVESCDTSVIIS